VIAATLTSQGHVDIHGDRDSSVIAAKDTNYSFQSTKEVFAGIQAKASQNVSGGVRQIAEALALASSGYGNPAYKAVAAMSAALSLTDAVTSLSNPTVSASLTLGASGSKSTNTAWAVNAVAPHITAGSLSVSAGRDVHLQRLAFRPTQEFRSHWHRNFGRWAEATTMAHNQSKNPASSSLR
jgi:hypothetical protein